MTHKGLVATVNPYDSNRGASEDQVVAEVQDHGCGHVFSDHDVNMLARNHGKGTHINALVVLDIFNTAESSWSSMTETKAPHVKARQ